MRRSPGVDEVFDGLAAGTLSRRELMRALGSAGLTIAAMPLLPVRAGAAGKPLIFEYPGYELTGLHPSYVEKHGGSPDFTFFGEEEEALEKLRGGFKPDTVHPCVESVLRYRLSGVVQPLDKSRIEHWDDLWGALKGLDAIWDGDQLYMVPFDWGSSSVVYRSDLIDIDEGSWTLLWDERYAGRMASFDSIANVIVAGLVTGAADPFAMTSGELAEAAEALRRQRDLMAFYWTDITRVEQALASGELVAAYAWNEGYVHLREQGVPVRFMIPREGMLTWACGIMRCADGPGDEGLVYDWINAMTSPEAGRFLIEEYGYGHSNAKAFDLVPIERLDALGLSSPDAMLATSIVFSTIAPKLEEQYIRLFEEVKGGT